ncbi:DNA-binding transcriptional regulator, LysR family [Actinacidiphila yanglinensis]|uniref:DNA-binding transcriptional regulator, LysR family n=1 Tax=Actinacidiphila yanglinensis TaxID=310779 RepID=A0A1H6CJE3_9ACTN|nr:LysR family transcriptional regulator [Actinacidiphila yanglinensis]SEG72526.1 DNA-binding transcriptional regulator, LysR family [Actinacidiphila yanglinensis]
MAENRSPHRQQLLRGLTFDQLFAVRTIASTGSFREASKILCLTQPAISQRVQHIEHILGSPIFDRHSGIGVTLTEAGRTFLAFCDRAMLDLDGLCADMAQSEDSDAETTLGITAPSDSIQYFIIRLLPLLRARFPDRQIRVTQSGSRGESLQMMRNGTADVAFYRVPLDPELSVVALMDEQLHLVAAPGHEILRIPVEERPGALGVYPFATYISSMRSRQLVERWSLKIGARLCVEIESQSLDVMKQAAVSGSALTVLPDTSIGEELKQGRLVIADIDGMPLVRATAIAVRPGDERRPAIQEFIDLLVRISRASTDKSMPGFRWATDTKVGGGAAPPAAPAIVV